MNSIEKDIRNYISDVGKNLVCSGKLKKQILKDIENDVLDYTDNKQITDINEIYAHFGTPEEIAKAYLSDAEPQNIKKAINIKKMLLVAIVIALAMLAITFIIAIIDSHSQNIAYYYNSDVIKDVSTTSSAVTIQVSHISLKASKT